MRRRIWGARNRIWARGDNITIKRLKTQNDELCQRWINQIHKEVLISDLLGLPPETAAAIADDIKVLINKQMAKEMGENG